MLSVVIPVYRNAENIADLVAAMERLFDDVRTLEVVFVIDGSPDESYLELATRLPQARFPSQLISLSRNFGTFAAMRAGLDAARGDCFAVMAADLQEPPSLMAEFYRVLGTGDYDVAVGRREARHDPLMRRILAQTYWRLYRRFVLPAIPEGGVDVFACTRPVRDHILQLRESNDSIVGLLFWVGFRRVTVPYVRRKRDRGRSAWTLRKRFKYFADSVFGFTDLPVRLLLRIGLVGVAMSVLFGAVVIGAKISGRIAVPGYAATVLTVTFFGGLNCLGLGIIGSYLWRTFENTKQRPNYLVQSREMFPGQAQTLSSLSSAFRNDSPPVQ